MCKSIVLISTPQNGPSSTLDVWSTESPVCCRTMNRAVVLRETRNAATESQAWRLSSVSLATVPPGPHGDINTFEAQC
ncbi:unnamed protein product [Arctogadus glacialis]